MSKETDKYSSDFLGELFSEITPQEQRKTDKRMLLAIKIKDGMNVKGWRNKQLAEALNQQPSVITNWLSGTHNFTTDTLIDLEEVLDITLLSLKKKKETQVIHYHLSLTSTVLNDRWDEYAVNHPTQFPVSFSKSKTKLFC